MAAGQWELRISEVYNHTHCHWCGKKMGWDGNQRKGGKGLNVPKMKRQSGVG